MTIQEKRIQSAVVRAICGDISDMSLWRWQNDPELDFPKPIYIGRRRYWKEAEVIAWLDRQARATPPAAPASEARAAEAERAVA